MVTMLATVVRAWGTQVLVTDNSNGQEILVRTNHTTGNPVSYTHLDVYKRQHLLNEEDGICRALADGITVLSDRYYFSSYAYQSVDLPLEWVVEANRPCADLLRPDVTTVSYTHLDVYKRQPICCCARASRWCWR